MPTEVNTVLNLLESLHGKAQVQEFLHRKSLRYSGTWGDVRRHVRKATGTEKVDTSGLVELLEEIEEHGNQYIFIFDLDSAKVEKALTPASIEQALTPEERRSVLNTLRVIEDPPEKPLLVSVRISHNPVKFKWVQTRLLHRHLGDSIRGRRLTVVYDLEPERAVDLAVLNVKDKTAYVCVQRVEQGIREYRGHLKSMLDRLKRFFEPESLTPFDLGKLMKTLADKNFAEVRRRRHQVRDSTGGTLDATSATETDDVFTSGGLYNAARENYSGELTDLHSNVYWVPNGVQLKREIHTLFPYRNFPNAVVFDLLP